MRKANQKNAPSKSKRGGRSRRPSQRRGTSLLEFALVLPVLVTIVVGCVDFGRYAHYYIAVTNAAGAGAEFAAFHPYTPTTESTWAAKTRQAVIDEMQSVHGYDVNKLTVPNPVVTVENNNNKLRRVRVEVRYTFDAVAPWPLIPNSVVLARAVEARMVR